MGGQKVVKKAITAAELIKALQGGSITIAQAQQMYNGVIPIGDLNGIAALYDINKQVIQPLVLAEKQWTLGKVDTRNGLATVNVPVGTHALVSLTDEIEVPEGEIWYLCEHEILIANTAALVADIMVNFMVSSFLGTDQLYYDVNDPEVYLVHQAAPPTIVAGGSLIATAAEIALHNIRDNRVVRDGAGALSRFKRNFRDGDELNTELRLVAGDVLTLVVTVLNAATAVNILPVTLTVWGRKGKVLVV